MPREGFRGTMVPPLKGTVHEGGGRMQNRTVVAAGVLGALLALGVVAGSFLMGGALVRFKMADRNVVVRGFAERNVEADLAIWPIVFQNTANDLTELQRLVDLHDAQIRGFLKAQGFEDGEISSMPPQITDRKTQPGMDPGVKLDERYMAQTAITLRSSKMGEVKVAMRKSGELVRKGIVLAQDYSLVPEFLFTKLDEIKPEMVAEATRSARAAAEQFAKDSGSRVGGIQRAEQGYFSIEDRDKGSPDHKKVRVVTTISYSLENP